MPQYMVKPANRILVGPGNAEIVEMKVGANATATKMVAGRFVVYDAADGAVKEAGSKADDVIGVIEVRSGKLLTDTHAIGDPVSIIRRGTGARVVVTLASGGASVVMGDALVISADGKLAKQAVGAMGAQGTVVAMALESADPSAGDKTIIAELQAGREPAAAA